MTLKITNTENMLLRELYEAYDAEHRFLEEQRELTRRAASEDLGRAIEEHIGQTGRHTENLEKVFKKLGEEPERSENEVAKGIISDAREDMEDAQSAEVRDCTIDAAVMKIEHFEIGVYRGMSVSARLEGKEEIAQLLEENLRQEEEAARKAEGNADTLLQKIQ